MFRKLFNNTPSTAGIIQSATSDTAYGGTPESSMRDERRISKIYMEW